MKSIIKINNLNKSYNELRILDNANLEITYNSKTALIGMNGVGKTTTLRLISGLDHEFSGEIKRNYINLSICFSDNSLPLFLSILDICRTRCFSLERLDELLIAFEILKYKNTIIKDLSLGTKTKMNIIFGLLWNHDFLILDEPTNSLDYKSVIVLKQILKKWDKTILIISHDFNLLEGLCDDFVIISEKKFVKIDDVKNIRLKIEEIALSNEDFN